MTAALTIARRELAGFLRLPVGWVAIALFAFITGLVVAATALTPGQTASMRTFFGFAGWLMLPVVPAVSMRLISEELKSGTIEPLMTSPASDAAIVVGKYLGGLGFLALLIAPTIVHALVIHRLSDPKPDWGPVAAGYLLLFLTGGLYLSIGLLASSLTSNQTLAFLATLCTLLVLLLAPNIAVAGLNYLPERFITPAETLLNAVNLNLRSLDFAKGVIDTSHVVFYASVSAFFVLLSTAVLASRRWR